jgi:hypothetical protein
MANIALTRDSTWASGIAGFPAIPAAGRFISAAPKFLRVCETGAVDG